MRNIKVQQTWILILFTLFLLICYVHCEKSSLSSESSARNMTLMRTSNEIQNADTADQNTDLKSGETENRRISNLSQEPADSENPGQGMKAIDHASKTGKYLFACFYRTDDEQSQKVRSSLADAVENMSDRAESVAINITDQSERGIVNKYGLSKAPMPLVLAISPGGAITHSFQKNLDKEQLKEAFVGPGLEKVLGALQQRKIVLLSIQNEKTKDKDAAMKGVRDFAGDTQYNKFTELVTLNPADPAEAKFLGQLKIDPKADEATTVFFVPPGNVIGVLKGATDKKMLEETLKKASSSCKPGGSCCPKK